MLCSPKSRWFRYHTAREAGRFHEERPGRQTEVQQGILVEIILEEESAGTACCADKHNERQPARGADNCGVGWGEEGFPFLKVNSFLGWW
jgi:hypothetical protein